MRWVLRALYALLILMLLAWGALHWIIVPRIDDFRPRLEEFATRAVSAPVTIGSLRAESNGLVPSVALHDVRIHDPSGRAGLVVPRALAAFSVLSLSKGELEQLVIERPELEMRRTQDGRLLVGGLDFSGQSSGGNQGADWFFEQPEFIVQGGQVRWVDEQRAAPAVQLSDVQLVVRNGFGRHQMRLDATPETSWGDRFTLVGRFRQPVFSLHAGQWSEWDGEVFADLGRADVSRLRQYVDLKTDFGVDVQGGQGALRLWADVQKGQLKGATADMALANVSATFGPKLEPLAFASLGGRIGWRDSGGGMEMSTRDLHFVDTDGVAWPGGNVRLTYRDGSAGGAPAGGHLEGERLDLAALTKIARRLPFPASVAEKLAEHPVSGLIERLDARWSGLPEAPKDWSLQTRLTNLSVGARAMPVRADGVPVEGIPGIEGAEVELQATPAGGSATLSVTEGALEFPGVFAEPRLPMNDLKLTTRWRQKDDHIAVDVDQLTLRNQDATGSFKARWHTLPGKQGADRFPGVLDLTGSFSRANGARVFRYLPLGIPAEAREYVRQAIRKGEARNVAVRIKGDLYKVGDNPPERGSEFRFAGQVSGVTMAYVPPSLQPEGQLPWPALEGLSGELIFDHSTMLVKNASGRVQGHPGWQFSRVQVGIADLAHTRVVVDAEGAGTLTSALDIANASPVGGFIGHALEKATASGDASLHLKLDIPVDRVESSKVDGRVQLAGNDVRITPGTPLLARAQGTISFNDTGFSIQGAKAHVLGGEARVSGGTQAQVAQATPSSAEHTSLPVVLNVSGTATAEGLREMAEWAPLPEVARQLTGGAGYEARVSFQSGQPEVLVTSDLRGLAMKLPAPLNKPADAAWPLRYESGPAAGSRDHARIQLAVGDQLRGEFETEVESGRMRRGMIGMGAQAIAHMVLPPSGVAAHVQAPRLDVDAWKEALTGMFGRQTDTATASGDNAYLPTVWTLNTNELAMDERVVHDVSIKGTREGPVWRADVQARELAGRLDFTEDASDGAGKLVARLSRLSIPDTKTHASAGATGVPEPVPSHLQTQALPPSQPARQMPSLDIVADQFELHGKKLGKLEINAINHHIASHGQGRALQAWELSRLVVSVPEAVFSASGRWDAQARGPVRPLDAGAPQALQDMRRTTLDFKLDIRDAGALLTRFDMPGVIARGEGQLKGDLSWRGSPISPHYPTMAGQLHLDVGEGQFLKTDPGAAKLLGVLSLQALPRRLTLDFSDIFSKGFAFDFVRGDVRVAEGVAHTNNLQMKGVNAAVLMDGSADIANETQDLRAVVVPEIDAGTAALVATAINPAIGLGAFLAQLILKKPLIQANTQEFHVGGSWDNPTVRKLDRPSQRASGSEPVKEGKP